MNIQSNSNRAERRAAASNNPSPPVVPRAAFTLLESADALGLSRATIYRMIEAGELRAIKLRGRRLIPASEIDRLVGGEAA